MSATTTTSEKASRKFPADAVGARSFASFYCATEFIAAITIALSDGLWNLINARVRSVCLQIEMETQNEIPL